MLYKCQGQYQLMLLVDTNMVTFATHRMPKFAIFTDVTSDRAFIVLHNCFAATKFPATQKYS